MAPDRDKNNYMTMTVTPNKLIVKAFLPDGTQWHEVGYREIEAQEYKNI